MKHLDFLVITLLLVFLLGGCAYTTKLVSGKKAYNDEKAKLATEVMCDISIGAYHRVLNDAEQCAADILCGGAVTCLLLEPIQLRPE